MSILIQHGMSAVLTGCTLSRRIVHLLKVLMPLSLAVSVNASAEDFPGTVSFDQFVEAHCRLRLNSLNVQRTIRVYRTETALPDDLEKSPEELGIPLVSEGRIWRRGDLMRLDFKKFKSGGVDHPVVEVLGTSALIIGFMTSVRAARNAWELVLRKLPCLQNRLAITVGGPQTDGFYWETLFCSQGWERRFIVESVLENLNVHSEESSRSGQVVTI